MLEKFAAPRSWIKALWAIVAKEVSRKVNFVGNRPFRTGLMKLLETTGLQRASGPRPSMIGRGRRFITPSDKPVCQDIDLGFLDLNSWIDHDVKEVFANEDYAPPDDFKEARISSQRLAFRMHCTRRFPFRVWAGYLRPIEPYVRSAAVR